jgi:hypothetical protein
MLNDCVLVMQTAERPPRSRTGLSPRAFVPKPIKRAARRLLRQWALHRALEPVIRLRPGEQPSLAALIALRQAWGNHGYAADVEFLSDVCRQAVRTEHPVLECGSGLSTVLLALLAGRRGIAIWTLEHDPHWLGETRRGLAQAGAPPARTCLAPLVPYHGFVWYAPPGMGTPPPAFGLVVCDGPPGQTPGGRYGLMPVMRERIRPGAVILLDDAERDSEITMLERWQKGWACSVRVTQTRFGTHALVRLP